MADDRLTICLSLARVAPSQYTNFNFKSMAMFGGQLYGANADGLYRLESGDRDVTDKIAAKVRTGPTDFGAEHEKRLRRLYVSYRTDGRMRMRVTADEKEEVVQDIIPHDNSLAAVHQKVPGGRDIRGKYLDLTLENVEGSDFTLNEVRATLIVLGQNSKEGA